MPCSSLGKAVTVLFVLVGVPRFAVSEGPAEKSPAVQALKTLLDEGIIRRAGLSQVSQSAQQALAVHEVGHQFELEHDPDYPGGSVMSAPPKLLDAYETRLPEIPLTFNDDDIKKMRKDVVNDRPYHP